MATSPTLPIIWDEFPELKKPLELVLQQVSSSWTIGFKDIDTAIKSQLNAGKLVRPALTLLFSELTDEAYNENAITLSASVELLHLATLIHDDIIDESKLRRGQTSIQTRFGKDTAVYSGDYLLTGMFTLLNKVNNIEVNQYANEALKEILFGELSQKQNRYRLDMTFDEYLLQIKGKTAALFRMSTLFGIMSRPNDEINNFRDLMQEIGETMGMTFQLLDDYLDFSELGDNLALGKPTGQDIQNGIYTAPILFALQDETKRNDLKQLLALRDAITPTQLNQLHELVVNAHAIEQLNDLLMHNNEQLNALIESLPDTKIKQQLQLLNTRLLHRHQ